MVVNPAQLAELSALLEQALDIPASGRQAWLATPPTTDPVVLAALSRALQLPTTAGGSAATAATSAVEADQPPTDSRSAAAYWLRSGRFSEMGFTGVTGQQGGVDASIVVGATMDRYRLLHAIGSGGMGTVWLAERIEGDIVRPVALKLPLRLAGNRQIAERFARERGMLAKLTHPNIATLYDAGVSDAGVPFLALEYVEGRPIAEYANGKWLTVASRLALFAQVLAAVQHAHERLVIHRDLKPSNILVKADGTAKLLDFGIAKLIEEGDDGGEAPASPATESGSAQPSEASQKSELTQQVGIAVTPNYASPEQLAGETLTTATDVYSLGVVLYELLTGTRPYRLKRENQAALAQGVLDAEVVPPSQSAMTESAATLRCSSPAKLKRLLSGDLDAIVLKALEKTTDTRYRTVEEFAADLRRYQQHQPVQAMPSSPAYRFKKYVSRNRIGVAATAAVSLAILAGIGATLWQLRETERELARRTAVQTFLVGIFKTADPEIARGKVYTAKELLSVAVERIDKQFADQPEVAAALYGEIGTIFTALGDEVQARAASERRLRVLERAGLRSRSDYVDALVRHGRNLHEQGERPLALTHFKTAIVAAENLGTTGNALRWEAMQKLASLRLDMSMYPEARALLTSARNEITAVPERSRPKRVLWLIESALGDMALERGEPRVAFDYLLHVEQLQRDDPTIARADMLRNEMTLGTLDNIARRYEAAVTRLAPIVQEHLKILGVSASETRDSRTELARALWGLGRADESLAMQLDILAAAKAVGNVDDINYAKNHLIRKLITLKRYAEAEQLTREALARSLARPSNSQRMVENYRTILAEIALATGRIDEALTASLSALQNLLKLVDPTSMHVAHNKYVLGVTYLAIGSYAEARDLHLEAARVFALHLGVDNVLCLRSQLYAALARILQNKPVDSAEWLKFDALVSDFAARLPRAHPAQQQIAKIRSLAPRSQNPPSADLVNPVADTFGLIDI